mmetsp:Transcript_11579/g.13098  ORF Transcript_11579/g.13098 Transcript_11579/m.13098 type:complete len:91 (+) Transcript_11579:1-273(+)
MGNSHHRLTKHAISWSSAHGCDHYNEDTIIIEQKWKTVPISEEEQKILHKRILKLASTVAIEATTGLKGKSESIHDAIEVSIFTQTLTLF